MLIDILGTFVLHYKNKFYKVIGIGYHTEFAEPLKHPLVFYQAQYDDPTYGPNALWNRPLGMFFEKVVLPEGNEVSRFTFVQKPEDE